ncbi:MAG: hypothetical protein PV362_11425 [Providencia heimbachae]|nr:hypothetical protein [Providencia heimbachae]
MTVILLCTSNAYSYTYGGSNIYGNYPSFNELEPNKPYSNDDYSWQNYKRQVEQYVNDAKEYAEKANNDIQRIQEEKSKAIEDANRVVENYNRHVRGY